MNFKIASRQSQQRQRAGIDGMTWQISQTASTTRLPCQQVFHIVVVQMSRRALGFIVIDLLASQSITPSNHRHLNGDLTVRTVHLKFPIGND